MNGCNGCIMRNIIGYQHMLKIHFERECLLHNVVKVWMSFFYGYVGPKTTLK